MVARARIVLLSGRGFGTNSIQREARVSKPTVWRWQKAYITWMVASSACSRTGARARAPARSRSVPACRRSI
ncbi:MAG: helix-turn-helix domain-containing protein [Rhodoplanes sp.]